MTFYVQNILYSYYLVYLLLNIYNIEYDKGYTCASDLREEELLFWFDFCHL